MRNRTATAILSLNGMKTMDTRTMRHIGDAAEIWRSELSAGELLRDSMQFEGVSTVPLAAGFRWRSSRSSGRRHHVDDRPNRQSEYGSGACLAAVPDTVPLSLEHAAEHPDHYYREAGDSACGATAAGGCVARRVGGLVPACEVVR